MAHTLGVSTALVEDPSSVPPQGSQLPIAQFQGSQCPFLASVGICIHMHTNS